MAGIHHPPRCVKCGSTANMVEQESGLTYQSWVCVECNVKHMRTISTCPPLTVGPAIITALLMFDADCDNDFMGYAL